MQAINKIRNSAAALIILAGVQLGANAQGMLGKRLSVDAYLGFAPKLPVIYAPITEEGLDPISSSYRMNYGLTTWNFNANLNYALGKRWEASLGLFGWRDYYVVDVVDGYPFSYTAKVPNQPNDVTFSAGIKLTPTRLPLTYYGTELSWKYYPNTFNSSESAPAGVYYRIGFGVTRYSAQIDRDAIRDNINLENKRAYIQGPNPSTPPLPVPFTHTKQQVADAWMSQMDMTELKSLNFHLVYGVGYQRFLGHKLYTKVGFEGRAPFFINNRYYEPFDVAVYDGDDEYFQKEAIFRARKGQWIKFTFGVGYMLY